MVTRSFIDVVTSGVSVAEQAKFSAGKSEFESRLNAVRAQRFPVLTRDTLCEGLPKGRAAILMRYLQSVMASELRRVARCSTFRFATSKTAAEAVKDLQEKGFPKGNFTWSYMGVYDYGSDASGRCALSGYPIRYGHVFVADANSITLV